MQLIGELVGALFMNYFHSFNFLHFYFIVKQFKYLEKKRGGGIGLGTRTIKLPFLPGCFLITTFVSLKCLCVKSRTMERQPPQRT